MSQQPQIPEQLSQIIEWIKRNWLLLVIVLIALIFVTRLFGRRRRIIIE